VPWIRADAELLAALFEATPQALLVCDARGQVRLANAGASVLTGHPRDALVGAPVELLLAPEQRRNHAAQRESWFALPTERLMAAGRLLTCRHAEGHDIPVEIRLSPLTSRGELLVLAAMSDLRVRQLLERRFELAVAAAPVGMLLLDDEARIVASNLACDRLFGQASGQLVGQCADRLLARMRPDTGGRPGWLHRLRMPCRLGLRKPLYGRRSDGTRVPIEVSLNLVPGSAAPLYLAVVSDLSEHHRLAAAARHAHEVLEQRVRERTLALEEANRAREALLKDLLDQRAVLEHLSREDALTGLANRRSFDEQWLAEARRAGERGLPLALAMLDLDHFKEVNDRFGHACGDAVLRRCAQLLQSHGAPDDLLARYGGEEFVWAMPGCDLATASRRCEQLRAALAMHDWSALRPGLAVTLSGGVAASSAGLDPAALLALADARLYAAKRAGRNRVEPSPN
jgi:diguanylate cyclase (GGDEF)-like protein/PAS domain S-box-containing protein